MLSILTKVLGVLFVTLSISKSISAGTVPSFSEFVSSTPRLENGVYYVDGDLPISSEEKLYSWYLRYYFPITISAGTNFTAQSAVKSENGIDIIWDASTARNLTYCIEKDGYSGFGSNYYKVSLEMEEASLDWEAAANINFIHKPLEDNNCRGSTSVLFKVIKTWATWQGGQLQAAAFFPDYPPDLRVLWIAADMPGNTPKPLSFRGLLRHELGHILGLVHEQARTSLCPETGWRPLTDYDRYSVMHYRLAKCNGVTDADYLLTSLDKNGISQLYPFPLPAPDIPNKPPVARIAMSGGVYVGQRTLLDGTASNDMDGSITNFLWDFGDGQTLISPIPVAEHKYLSIGSYTANLRVKDDKGLMSQTSSVVLDVTLHPAVLVSILNLILL